MIERIDERLSSADVHRYELTNYARPGFESVHNRRYWERAPVLGVGLGAWSSDAATPAAPYGSRRMNTREFAVYLSRIEAGVSAADHDEIHDAHTARGEAVFLGLRCATGLPASRFRRWFGEAPRAWFADEIDDLVGRALLAENADGDLRLTADGRRLSDLVSQAFV
jgi:oxygen-independent coproporphyrinogen-3 oxidase